VHSLYPGATVRWTTNELLYAEKMKLPLSQEPIPTETQWKELPLMRTSHIYAAYSVDLFNTLLTLHAMDGNLCSLIKEIAQVEHQGPIHVSVD
jgi:hypothetical protein